MVCDTKLAIMHKSLSYAGTKNVAKELQKITKGLVRDKGKTWFPELADKRM